MAWGACAAPTPIEAPLVGSMPFPSTEGAPYLLQAGDVLAIKFWGNPDLDEEVTIRPDGRISLPFIDEIDAAGLSPADLDGLLTERYSGELTNPQITVIVREFNSQKVYVGGEVELPSAIEITGTTTLMQAIQAAEYFTPGARRKDVLVIRTMPNGERLARQIDLRPVLSGENLSDDIVLQASDIVIVPRRRVTNVNQFLAEYFYDMLPVRFVWTYDLATE
jgi:protein involved in polysaccharide export with SLBB domain